MGKAKLYLFSALLSAALATSVQAQTVQGVITGTVTDPTGAVVPSAEVKLTNEGTGVQQNTHTEGGGIYRFPLVPPGTYTVTITAAGFNERVIKDIVVDASSTVPVDATLRLATAATTVDVTTESTLVQTDTSDLNTTVNTRTIESTPLVTRSVFDLAFLAPQVTQGMNFGVSSGGSREQGTSYLLNGAENNDNFGEGSYNVQPPLESVAEFTVMTNQFSAQYGRGGGAVVSATQKSGTNRFHGVAYEFNRNADFDANDFFSNRQGSPIGHYVRNQFGGEIDGPIIKNKTFFAFAYDEVALHTGGNDSTYTWTPSELSAVENGAGPLAQYYLSKYKPQTSTTPCPNQAAIAPDSIGHVACLFYYDPNVVPQHNYFGKIDHNFSEKNRLAFSLNFTRSANTDLYGGGYANNATPESYVDAEHYHNLALVHTYAFSPSLINELTVAHNRHYSYSTYGDPTNTAPEIIIDLANYGSPGTLGFGGNSEYQINAFTQDRWQWQDNVSMTKGRHSIKIGGGFVFGQLYRNWDLGGPGQYEFANTLGPTAASVGSLNPNGTIGNVNYSDSNFQNDFPYYQELAVDPTTGAKANAYRHYTTKDAYLFIQDDFKVRKNLTLNLGLRWDRYGAPTEANNLEGGITQSLTTDPAQIAAVVVGPVNTFWHTNNHDFGPRVGFAWDVFGNGKLAVRGGYAIMYDRIFDNVWSNGAWNTPYYALVDHDATNGDLIYYSNPTSTGASYVPNSIPAPGAPVSTRLMDPYLKDTSTQNFSFTVEHQLMHDMLFRLGYQGSLGRHLADLLYANSYDGDRYNANLSTERPNPLYTGMNYRANDSSSNFNGMTTELQKRFSHGLQFQFSYMWSKLLDYNSDLFQGETTQGGYSQPYYHISNVYRNLDYGLGAFNHTNAFKFNFVYELPWLKNKSNLLGQVLGGWQLSAFYQGYSGHPLEVYNSRTVFAGNAVDANGVPENLGGDYNLNGVDNDRPTYVGTGNPYSGGSPADGIFVDNNPIGCGYAGQKSTNTAACNAAFGVSTPNSMFVNPSGGPIRYGTLGRNVFNGPWFNGMDASLMKNFRITETLRLQFRGEALNALNHPNFDCITTDLSSGNFGRAGCLAGNGIGSSGAIARQFQLGLRVIF